MPPAARPPAHLIEMWEVSPPEGEAIGTNVWQTHLGHVAEPRVFSRTRHPKHTAAPRAPSSTPIRPFKFHASDEALGDLRRRIPAEKERTAFDFAPHALQEERQYAGRISRHRPIPSSDGRGSSLLVQWHVHCPFACDSTRRAMYHCKRSYRDHSCGIRNQLVKK